MDELLVNLLKRLGEVSKVHREIFDSDVREAMRDAIHDGFLSPKTNFSIPSSFGMYSEEGNSLVRESLKEYITLASRKANELGLDFRGRYAAFQDDDVEEDGPKHLTYDSVFGYIPAEAYDDTGTPKEQW